MTHLLEKARAYELSAEKKIGKMERPEFHLSPRCGWMNDPNGFSFYQGQYHLFYQYYPYEAKWGPMHWGHAVSRDLLHWDYLPCALAPDQDYDKDGCFSGCAVTLADGRHLLLYTGVTEADVLQVQCVATGDGIRYDKLEGNPVIGPEMLPEGFHKEDFRDPKLIRTEDGYGLVVAARGPDENGCLLYYESKDAFSYDGPFVLLCNTYQPGKMWECPDLFELDGWDVLLVSPMDHAPEALIGRFDREEKKFYPERRQLLDEGSDFYAPQTVQTPDGRRIMIAWMQSWSKVSRFDPSMPWAGQMTLPRELHMEGKRIVQRIPAEFSDLHLVRENGKTVIRDRFSRETFYDSGETESTAIYE